LINGQIEAMTDAEADRYLAEKVMGWRINHDDVWCNNDAISVIAKEKWSPTKDLNQAIEAAEEEFRFSQKRGGWIDLRGPDGDTSWTCVGHDPSSGRSPIGRAALPARAVCNAVIAAHEASIK
jgi:hypothetical protein